MILNSNWIHLLFITLLSGGCAQKTIELEGGELGNPQEVMNHICHKSQTPQEVKGTVWMRAKSREASGQFPAHVLAQAPDQLHLEVTNLIGSTEAIIQVRGESYEIAVPGKNRRKKQGYGTWGGIPLFWAHRLFLGQFPCPSRAQLDAARLNRVEEEGLKVRVERKTHTEEHPSYEEYTYYFSKWSGKPWVSELVWVRKGVVSAQVEFKFSQPDDETGSPLKWSAKSKRGEVKVRWKDRRVSF